MDIALEGRRVSSIAVDKSSIAVDKINPKS